MSGFITSFWMIIPYVKTLQFSVIFQYILHSQSICESNFGFALPISKGCVASKAMII